MVSPRTYSRTAGETVAGSPYVISASLSPTGVSARLLPSPITPPTSPSPRLRATRQPWRLCARTDDGSVKSATATTNPPNLTVDFTYDPASPTQPGDYSVSATVNDPNYTGTASGTLKILAKYTITLVPGWNLVSFNLQQPYPSRCAGGCSGKLGRQLWFGLCLGCNRPSLGRWSLDEI